MKNPASSDLASVAGLLSEFRAAGWLLTARGVAGAEPIGGPVGAVPFGAPRYRSERADQLLAELCARGGFSNAVLADHSGLPVAEHNTPREVEAYAAFASVVGVTLDQAQSLLGRRRADRLEIDLGNGEVLLVRRFSLAAQAAYLLLSGPASKTGRTDLEPFIARLTAVLSEAK